MTHQPGIDEHARLNGYTAWRHFEPRVLSEVLAAVAELNEQVLDALAESARRTNADFPLAPTLRSAITTLTSAQRRQAARCGVLLGDAGFSDLARWRHVAVPSEYALLPDDERCWLSSGHSAVLAYAVLMVAWHVVHISPAAASVLLGMTEPVMVVYHKLGVGDLAHIARCHPGWVQPRWRDRPDVWVSMVEVAAQAPRLEPASMILRCLKVSANHSTRLIAAVETDT
jgi:hypothetical protein